MIEHEHPQICRSTLESLYSSPTSAREECTDKVLIYNGKYATLVRIGLQAESVSCRVKLCSDARPRLRGLSAAVSRLAAGVPRPGCDVAQNPGTEGWVQLG